MTVKTTEEVESRTDKEERVWDERREGAQRRRPAKYC